jgi:hypothetical protein
MAEWPWGPHRVDASAARFVEAPPLLARVSCLASSSSASSSSASSSSLGAVVRLCLLLGLLFVRVLVGVLVLERVFLERRPLPRGRRVAQPRAQLFGDVLESRDELACDRDALTATLHGGGISQ